MCFFFCKKNILLSQGNRSRLNEITLEYIDIEREHFFKVYFCNPVKAKDIFSHLYLQPQQLMQLSPYLTFRILSFVFK